MKLMQFQIGCLLISTTLLTGASAKAQAADNPGEVSKLQWQESGILRKLKDLAIADEVLLDDQTVPKLLKSQPKGLVSPHYGVLKVGKGDKAKSIFVIMDKPKDRPRMLYVNTKGDGEMADDQGHPFIPRTFERGTAREAVIKAAEVTIDIPFPDGDRRANLIFRRAQTDDEVYCYPDFGYVGETTIDGKPVATILRGKVIDNQITGEIVLDTKDDHGSMNWFDLNGGGSPDPSHDKNVQGNKPFKFHGKEWSVASVGDDGTIRIVALGENDLPGFQANAAEINKPLHLKFTAVDGTKVDLQSMHGKVVLIDFWATWCGPCRDEIPDIRRAYEKLHDRGFEIIGISLDDDKHDFAYVTKKDSMTWPQFFDGEGWDNVIAKHFDIDSIPRMWLVDKNGVLVDQNAGDDLQDKVEKLLQDQSK